ncbi:hypothetical protein [Paucibacter sp. KBW04]|uniref:hypothetical protein n=1 Tax=Paucibacter sp. KBW04 TaxID=2153361 RepID=UPI000F573721|nr:hypothetical protein [Paucibacter sp. KBW04]
MGTRTTEIRRATLADLQNAVVWSDECPGRLQLEDVHQLVGITAKRLGFNALGQGLALDLGNGFTLTCTTSKTPEVKK